MNIGVLDSITTPKNWSWRRLWTVAPRVKEVGKPDWAPLSVYLEGGVVPRYSRDDNHNRLGEDLSRYLVVRPGDVVFNKLRTWQGGLGVSHSEGIVSPAYYVCRPRSGTESRYLHYLLRSAPYLAELSRISKWMPPSQFDIPWENLRSLPLLLPPLEEQRRIADFLDAETAEIDRILTARTKQHDVLRERGAAAVSEVLIPGILTAPLNEQPWPWLPSIGSDQPMVRLGYIAYLQNGLTVDGQREVNGNVVTRPYLRVANVQAGSLDLDSVTEVTVPKQVADRCTLRLNDVLMTEGGDLDKLGRGTVWRGELPECLHQNHIFAIRPDPDRLEAEYLAYMTQTVHGRCYFESTGVRTTNLASTNSRKIMGFPIPLPSIPEQKALVRRAREVVSEVEAARTLLERQRSLLLERRSALITAAVTGEFDVSSASGRGVTE